MSAPPPEVARSVEFHARRAAAASGRYQDLDDHRQDGWLGYCQAAQRFDGDAGAQINTFAAGRIRGQIVDGIRERTFFGPSASRSRRPLVKISLDDPRTPHLLPCSPSDPEDDAARAETAAAVRRALEALPEQQAQVLRMHYFEELPLTEVARRLGMSHSNASRLHVLALRALRRRWTSCAPG
jgi:RNA polymerase sigma factor (sigma-70 family)